MRRAVVERAFVVPALDAVARGISGQFWVERFVKAQKHALVHRREFLEQCAFFSSVADAREAADAPSRSAPDLEAGEVKLAVRRIHRAVERRKREVAREGHDRRLRFGEAIAHQNAEDLGPVVAEVDHFFIERPHFRIAQPHLRHAAGIHGMRYPRHGIGDGLRILLLRLDGGEMAVELVTLDDVERRRGHIVSLLIARGDEAGFRMHTDKRLSQAVTEHLIGFSIRRDANDRAIVLAQRRALLPALADDERAIRRELHRVRKLTRLSGLRKTVAEHFINIGLAAAGRVAQFPDAVAIEDENV